jgi:hypothetical protein
VIHALKEAGLQIPVPTNRKYIRGRSGRVSKHIIVKPVTNNLISVDVSGIGRRKRLLPGEVLD